MKRALLILGVLYAASGADAQPVGTAFTYQGRLTDSGAPATGTYDLRFILYDADAGGSQVGPTVIRDDVPVTEGLFTVSLDFGAVFGANKRFLEIAVRPGASGGGYATLSSRQDLAPSPHSIRSQSALAAPWSGLTGVPAGFADGVDNDSGGTVTSVATGMGLAGGPINTSGTISVSFGTTATTVASGNHDHFGQSWSGGGDGLTVTSTNAVGVHGAATATSSTSSGVYGTSTSTLGVGVSGYASATTGSTAGVAGLSEASAGFGGRFTANSNVGQNVGVYGRADGNGVGGDNRSWGVIGHHYYSGVGVGAWSYSGNIIEGYDGDFPSGTRRMYLDQAGNLFIDGTFNTYAPTGSGTSGDEYRGLTAIQSPEVWLEDLGQATLAEGQAAVTIEPLFAKTVNTDVGYHVYVTPLCSEPVLLFVSSKDARGFVVRGVTLAGQPSQCAFDYRVVAKPTGLEDRRLPVVGGPVKAEDPAPPHEAKSEPSGSRP